MRSGRTLLALCLLMFAQACSTSSPPNPHPSEALRQAEAKVLAKLEHPLPAAALTLCQNGSDPQLIERKWECPPPPEVTQAIQSAPLLEVVARLTGALRKEVDMRFQLLKFGWPAAGPPASPAPPPAE